jgi:hypothetical protein
VAKLRSATAFFGNWLIKRAGIRAIYLGKSDAAVIVNTTKTECYAVGALETHSHEGLTASIFANALTAIGNDPSGLMTLQDGLRAVTAGTSLEGLNEEIIDSLFAGEGDYAI